MGKGSEYDTYRQLNNTRRRRNDSKNWRQGGGVMLSPVAGGANARPRLPGCIEAAMDRLQSIEGRKRIEESVGSGSVERKALCDNFRGNEFSICALRRRVFARQSGHISGGNQASIQEHQERQFASVEGRLRSEFKTTYT
jgi:hypothetical protein